MAVNVNGQVNGDVVGRDINVFRAGAINIVVPQIVGGTAPVHVHVHVHLHDANSGGDGYEVK
jgi:hypothetical protein